VIIETYTNQTSFIHQVDLRLRLFFAVMYSFSVALSESFITLILSVAVSLFLVYLAKLSIKKVAARIKAVFLFLVFIWIFLPLSGNGPVLYQFGTVCFYADRIPFFKLY